jgi:cytoskeletal protein RodZ
MRQGLCSLRDGRIGEIVNMMKASECAALVVLAGLLLLFGATAQAAPSSATSTSATSKADASKPAKPRSHSSRRHSDSKTVQKSDDKTDKPDQAAATAQADEAKTGNKAGKEAGADVPGSNQMPPEVANANAQLAPAEATPPAAAATAMTGRANDNVQAAADNTAAPNAESQVVASDQLNDLDRALQQDSPPAQKAVIAATDAQPRPAPVMASSQPNSAWDQSSLIGKIFIGVGTLLTLASAARMFMA